MADSASDSISASYDSPWKEAIEYAFEDFVAFFFPDIHADINWQEGYDFLDAELQQVVHDAELGRRLADKLVRVRRKNGDPIWVLIHIEIQGQFDRTFERRMFTYHYRIYDRYDQQVV